MKTLIVYASIHHGNTRRIVEKMAGPLRADLIDLTRGESPNPAGYGLIGLASGVYFHGFHRAVRRYGETAPFRPGQRVFLASTCGAGHTDYSRRLRQTLERRGLAVLGSFQCRGYDTYGIFGLLGGVAKGRPDEEDLRQAALFARKMLQKAGQ